MRGRTLRRGRLPRPLRVLGALAGVLSLTVMSMVIPLGAPPVAHAAGITPVTKKMPASGQPMVDGKGKKFPLAEVTVSQTENLQQRQVVKVSWKGFEASRLTLDAGSPPVTLPAIHYPVVLVECWGTDTPEKPMDPTHCQGPAGDLYGGHRMVLSGGIRYLMTDDKDGKHGGVPNPTDVSLENPRFPALGPNTLNFVAADGTHYNMQSGQGISGTDGVPPSLQRQSDALPQNSVLTWSDTSGSRSDVEFEVRGGSDLPVLGCSYHPPGSEVGACTLEVIPIVRPWCDPSRAPARYPHWKTLCTREPATDLPPGDVNNNTPLNPFLYGDTWWLGSQWKNRFAFPLNIAPASGECPVVDQRPTVSVQGSEAATVLMSSWNQFFCFDPRNPFKLTHSNTPESTARAALRRGGAKGIYTSVPVTDNPQPVVHAPVAVTGWTVAYALDQCAMSASCPWGSSQKPGARYTDLTLSPLLLAKLMTESYSGGEGHEPVLAGNRWQLFADPEFRALNPGFEPGTMGPMSGANQEVGVIWDVNDADAFAAMFAYVDADPEARAWLNGRPDSYSGMVVNPAYRGLSAPQFAFSHRDDWVQHGPPPPPGQKFWSGQGDCWYRYPMPWYQQITQLSEKLETAALAVLSRKPQYQDCKGQLDSNGVAVDYKWGAHTASQNVGERRIIAFTTVPLAERYGLSMAKLQSHTPNSRSVAPAGWEASPTGASTSYDTLAAALGYTKSDKDTGIVSPDFSVFPYNGAYPGVLPVYAAIPTCGLDATLAGQYADFLTFAADAGQTPGTLAGTLPPGYTPLPKAYADYTRQAAQAVRNQTCAVPPPPNDPGGSVRDQLGLPAPGSDGSGFPSGSTGLLAKPGNGTPGAATTPGSTPGTGAAPSSATKRPTTVAATRGSDSWLAGWGLAILLGVGLLAGVAVPLVQIAAQPGHPVRRFFASTADQAGARLRRTRQKSP